MEPFSGFSGFRDLFHFVLNVALFFSEGICPGRSAMTLLVKHAPPVVPSGPRMLTTVPEPSVAVAWSIFQGSGGATNFFFTGSRQGFSAGKHFSPAFPPY